MECTPEETAVESSAEIFIEGASVIAMNDDVPAEQLPYGSVSATKSIEANNTSRTRQRSSIILECLAQTLSSKILFILVRCRLTNPKMQLLRDERVE